MHRIGTTVTEVSLRYTMWHHFCIAHVVLYVSDLFAKLAGEIATCLYQPESCDFIKNAGCLWDLRAINKGLLNGFPCRIA